MGLTVHSNYSEFQAYFYNAGMHECPRPCMPQALSQWLLGLVWGQEEPCVEFGTAYPGGLRAKRKASSGKRYGGCDLGQA